MKTAEPKNTSVATMPKSGKPFFSKGGDGDFFGEIIKKQTDFFKPSTSLSVGGKGVLQTKLTIGQPNDKYEQEADSMADRVVQRLATPETISRKENGVQAKPLSFGITPVIQAKCTECENEEKLQKKEEDELQKLSLMDLRRKPIFESNAEPPDEESSVQRKCAECEREDKLQAKEEKDLVKESPLELQRKPIFESNAAPTYAETSVQPKCAECEGEEKLQTKEDEDLVQESPLDLQCKRIFDSEATIDNGESSVQLKCAECEREEKLRKKEEEETEDISPLELQRKPISESVGGLPEDNSPGEAENVQAKSDVSSTGSQLSQIENTLNSSKGNGSPIDRSTRQQMETSFGVDFSSVRIHSDSTAVQMSKDLHAQAFTHGSDIYFNSGKYDTGSESGRHLLAHELTHTVQQNAVSGKIQRQPSKPAGYVTDLYAGDPRFYVAYGAYYPILDKPSKDIADKLEIVSKLNTIKEINTRAFQGAQTEDVEFAKALNNDIQDENRFVVEMLNDDKLRYPAGLELIKKDKSGWKSLLLALSNADFKIRIYAEIVLKDHVRTNKGLLHYLAETAEKDDAQLRVSAISILSKAGFGNYFDNKNFVSRIIQKLEFINVFFDSIPLPTDKMYKDIRDVWFKNVRKEVSDKVASAILEFRKEILLWDNLINIAQAVEIFNVASAMATRVFSWLKIFNADEWTIHNQSVYEVSANLTKIMGDKLNQMLSFYQAPEGFTASPSVSIITANSFFTICSEIPKYIASASIKDLELDLYRAERDAIEVIDGLKESKPPNYESYVQKVKEIVGTVNGIQTTFPKLSLLAWERPMVYFEILNYIMDLIAGMINQLTAISSALTAFSLGKVIDDSWRPNDSTTPEAIKNREILRQFLHDAQVLIAEHYNDPDKLGAEIEKLRSQQDYKTAIAWAQKFAVDEAEFRELVVVIAEVIFTLASIWAGGVAGRLVGAGVRFAAARGIAAAVTVAGSRYISGAIVLGADTLGFVVTDKLLHQLFFGKGGWDTFLSDYVKAYLTFGALKGTGRLFEGLVSAQKLPAIIAKIGQFGVEVATLTGMQIVWETLEPTTEGQAKLTVWEKLVHNALFLILLKVGMVGLRKFPPPLLAKLEKKVIDSLDARTASLEKKLSEFVESTKGNKEVEALHKEIKDLLEAKRQALLDALANDVFKGNKEDINATKATIAAISSRIAEIQSVLELLKFDLKPTENPDVFTFDGKPEKLKEVLDKRGAAGAGSTFELIAGGKDNGIYKYQVPGEAPIYLEQVSKASKARVGPSEAAKARGFEWRDVRSAFWKSVIEQGFKYDDQLVSSTESNLKIRDLLESGWKPGDKLPKEIGTWLELYYAKERAARTKETETKPDQEEVKPLFEDQLNELLKLNPESTRPAQLNSMIKSLRLRGVHDNTILNIIRLAFTNAAGMRPNDLFADVNVIAGKPGDVLGKTAFDALINGLANESSFAAARFMASRASWNQMPQVRDILTALTIEDFATLRSQFKGGNNKDFTNNVAKIVRGLKGSRDDIFALLNEAGPGPLALNKLAEAVSRLGAGKFSPTEIRDSLSFGKKLEEAFADPSQTEPLVSVIFGKAYEGKEGETFKVAAGIKKAGNKPISYVFGRVSEIVNNLLDGGQGKSINETKWGVIRKIIEATDLATVEKNGIIGKIWAEANLQLERNLDPDLLVQDQVSMRYLLENGTWSKDFGIVDGVTRKGTAVRYKEYKSSETASFSDAQKQIYEYMRTGQFEKLQPFGENAEVIFGGKDMPFFKPGDLDVVKPKDK